jgi:Xaa-Pro aminopeptidase
MRGRNLLPVQSPAWARFMPAVFHCVVDKKVQESGNPVVVHEVFDKASLTSMRSSPADFSEKLTKIRSYLERTGRTALVLGRRDNFSWLTGGGDNTVVRSSEMGFCLLVVTDRAIYLVAQEMDGPRILDEELQGIGVEPLFLKWYEKSREEKAAELIRGRDAVADVPLDGAMLLPREIAMLHYPLTAAEVERCRQIGRTTEEVIGRVAASVVPGMRECEIEARFLAEYAREGMSCDVLLVGSDERIARYRHPLPSEKPVERLVLLHPAVRKWGLHANVTRMVYFGNQIPEDVAARYEAACRIEAAAVSQCIPGRKFAGILETEKRAYQETGFPAEWRNHYQGGVTGYVLADAALCTDPSASVSANQTFDWFITITGVKVEELSLSGPAGPEVLSACGGWPLADFEHDGVRLRLPQIMRR